MYLYRNLNLSAPVLLGMPFLQGLHFSNCIHQVFQSLWQQQHNSVLRGHRRERKLPAVYCHGIEVELAKESCSRLLKDPPFQFVPGVCTVEQTRTYQVNKKTSTLNIHSRYNLSNSWRVT